MVSTAYITDLLRHGKDTRTAKTAFLGTTFSYNLTVTQEDQVERAVKEAVNAFGRIDYAA